MTEKQLLKELKTKTEAELLTELKAKTQVLEQKGREHLIAIVIVFVIIGVGAWLLF